jgi:hypothetical protein
LGRKKSDGIERDGEGFQRTGGKERGRREKVRGLIETGWVSGGEEPEREREKKRGEGCY